MCQSVDILFSQIVYCSWATNLVLRAVSVTIYVGSSISRLVGPQERYACWLIVEDRLAEVLGSIWFSANDSDDDVNTKKDRK